MSPQTLAALLVSGALHGLIFLGFSRDTKLAPVAAAVNAHESPPRSLAGDPNARADSVRYIDAPTLRAEPVALISLAPNPGEPTSPGACAAASARPEARAHKRPRKTSKSPVAMTAVVHTAGPYATRDVSAELSAGNPNAGADSLLYGEGSPKSDLTSPPRLGGPKFWDDCPWPTSAVTAGINRATVQVTVDVSATGAPVTAHLIRDAGHDFGADAVECAMQYRYVPGRDAQGRAVPGRTRPFPVVFTRREVR